MNQRSTQFTRILLLMVLCLGVRFQAVAQSAEGHSWLPASAEELPRWRGFNLQNKFMLEWANGPFEEKDFQRISELGFNFVRLPMDYRTWIKYNDWRSLDEAVLEEIDQAVAWGGQYGLHVCLNFHRAPGWTVAEPKEEKSLWSDPEAQEVCALHWAAFAKRYKGIPNVRLSFNLFNEPGGVDEYTYAAVVDKIVAAIRAEDPDRLIISDGLEYGSMPAHAMRERKIPMAGRGYVPMHLTHYKASWVNGSDSWGPPDWPMPIAPGFLYGPIKAELKSAMMVRLAPRRAGRLRVRVGQVSSHSRIVVRAGSQVLLDQPLPCGPGEGEWREAEYQEAYDNWRNTYDKDYYAEVPPDAEELSIENSEGDWCTVTELGFADAAGNETVIHLGNAWGEAAPTLTLEETAGGLRFSSANAWNKEWLRQEVMGPWRDFEASGGVVMIGEFGAFNTVPHDVTLRWMEDYLDIWREADWGWALWNFSGAFGILDSDRKDVDYEDWRGHKLDRKMLDLLQRY